MASEDETTQTTPTEGTDNNNQTTDTPNTGDGTTGEPDGPESVIDMIVEDGSCTSGANSYISLEDAIIYQQSRYRSDWLALTEDEQKASLIKGTQYIDNLFTWKGRRKFETQILAFPRAPKFPNRYLRDYDGFDYTGKIPQKIKDAVCEAAFYGYQQDLFTVYESESGIIKRDKKRVEGAVETEVEYFSNKESEVDYISKYAALNSILRGFYVDKNAKTVNAHAIWRD